MSRKFNRYTTSDQTIEHSHQVEWKIQEFHKHLNDKVSCVSSPVVSLNTGVDFGIKLHLDNRRLTLTAHFYLFNDRTDLLNAQIQYAVQFYGTQRILEGSHEGTFKHEVGHELLDNYLIDFCQMGAIVSQILDATITIKVVILDNERELSVGCFRRRSSDFKALLYNEALSDVTLVASGVEVPAHKSILAARSPVFFAMFTVNMKESFEGKVEIDDVDPEVLTAMLKYIYAEKWGNWGELAGQLLVAADKYAIVDLKSICEQELLEDINNDNAIDTLIIADRGNASVLKENVLNFIVENAKDVVGTAGFGKLSSENSYAHLLAEAFSALALK